MEIWSGSIPEEEEGSKDDQRAGRSAIAEVATLSVNVLLGGFYGRDNVRQLKMLQLLNF